MKRIFLFVLIFTFCCGNLFSQSCLPNDITFTTQQQIDDFATNYPGCTQILGDIIIDGVTNNTITSLGGLSQLTSIAGNLTIAENYALTDLSGLNNLSSIQGDLILENNDDLTNLNGLNNLSSIGGDLVIGGYYWPTPLGNSSLVNLAGLENLTTISGELRIDDNNNLINLVGLNNLTSIGEDLKIYGNNALTSLNGLNNLLTVGDNVEIGSFASGNQSLTNLSGLSNLMSTGKDLWIYDNDNLTDISGLSGITSVIDLKISKNDALTSLTGLENITSVGGYLVINENNALTGLTSLDNVTLIGGYLYIYGNPALTDLAGLDNITSIGNSLNISNNVALIDLTGLENVTSIGSYLKIGNNAALTDLAGLENVTSINSYLEIRNNAALTNLTGLENVTSINGYLKVYDNTALTGLTGLENIDYTGITDLEIYSNPNLSICGLPNICDYLAGNTTLSIYDNASGCNNISEICSNVIFTCNDVRLNSQAEVDDFIANYSTCDTIFGNLRIDNVTDISGLSFVTAIMGGLYFDFSPLSSVDGLEQLTYVGGDIVFFETQISDISALDHPIEIGGTVRFIEDNINLTNCAVQSFCEHLVNNGFQAISFEDQVYSCENSLTNCAAASTTCPTFGTLEFYRSPQPAIFTALYPNCTTYNGNIWTKGLPPDYYGYVSLDLPNLHTLNGNMIITVGADVSNMGLVHLNGSISTYDEGTLSGTFNSLEAITGGVHVGDGYGSSVYVSFPVLKYIGGSVSVSGAEGESMGTGGFTALERIEGGLYDCTPYGGGLGISESAFPALKYLGGDIDIDRGTISGLNMLDTIAGTVIIEDCYYPDFHYVSVAITGLNELDYVGSGGLNFGEYNCVSDLSGLCNYWNNGGSISVYANSCSLSEFDLLTAACPTATCPTGDLTLTTQQEIDDFANIPNCTSIPGKLTIRGATPTSITNLDGLSQLTSLGNGLLIDGNAITNLSGLHNLTTTGNNLVITNNPNLTSLAGLENITSTASHLKIENNDLLTDLTGLEGITSVGESVLIFENDNLQDFSGLDNLTSIGLQLYIQSNVALTDFSGLENLTSIGTDIRLYGNNVLDNITALSNVTSVGGYIRVSEHNTLTSLDGLENIDPISITNLILTKNANLAVCSQQSICSYLENGGTATINNNASGCNTQAEIAIDCVSSCASLPPIIGTNSQSISDGIYRAADEVNSTGTVPTGGDVNFKAAQTILLNNNFTIEPNANFSAEIKGCTGQ